MKEEDLYEAVADFLASVHSVSCQTDVAKSSLTSVDVLGWKDDKPAVACEVKLLSAPVGAEGYGSIGQALMLRVFVPLVYVAFVVGETTGSKDCSLQNPKETLLQLGRDIASPLPSKTTFDAHCEFAKDIFVKFFGDTSIGLLMINADESPYKVRELVQANPHTINTFPAPWVAPRN